MTKEFGDWSLRDIRMMNIREFMAALSDEGLSASRKRQILNQFSALMKAAVADGLILTDPTFGVERPKLPPPSKAFLTREEFEQLCTAIPDKYVALVRLLFPGGLRIAEALGIQIQDVLHNERAVFVRRSLSEAGGRLHNVSTKTGLTRKVFLPPWAFSDVLAHIAKHRPTAKPNDWLFVTAPDRPLRYPNFRQRVWIPALEAAGLPAHGTHIGRHSTATWLPQQGWSIPDVQAHLGQATASVTLAYAASPEDHRSRLAARLGVTKGRSTGSPRRHHRVRHPPIAGRHL